LKRVVLDTNVTVSAFFWDGYPRTIYNLIRDNKIALLISKHIEDEFIRVMCYSKFAVSSKELLPFVRSLRSNSEFIKTSTKLTVIASDPTDNIFLEYAVDGKADYIISGDRHLLDVGKYSGITILKAKDFLDREGYLSF